MSSTFVATFAKYITKDWFPYFMCILVAFELGLFLLAKDRKKNLVELAPKRKEREKPENVPSPGELTPPQSPKNAKAEKASGKKNK